LPERGQDRPSPVTELARLLAQALPGEVARRLPPPRLLRTWRELVGPYLARRARPVCLEPGGELVVAVAGAACRQELGLAAGRLCRALREAGWRVERLRLVNLSTAPPQPPPEPPPPELTPGQEETLAALLAGVRDYELRQALARALRAQMQRDRLREP
jgi:hypothetical protein